MSVEWKFGPFAHFSSAEMYDALALRSQVFVVEQNAVYLDLDGLDGGARHLIGRQGGEIAAYLRVLDPGVRFADFTIGRVIVAPSARKDGLGRTLVREGLARLFAELGKPVPTALAAQAHLEAFYGSIGYVRTSREPFYEDGILHVDMDRPALPLQG